VTAPTDSPKIDEKEDEGETMLVSFTNQQFSHMADSYGSRSDDDEAVSSPDVRDRTPTDKSKLLTGPASPYKTFSPLPSIGNGNGSSPSSKPSSNGYENIE